MGGCIKHNLDHAFDVAIHWSERADIHAQPAGNGRSHGCDIKLLALYLAAFDHLFGECCQIGLSTQSHADISQTPHQEALGATCLSHWLG